MFIKYLHKQFSREIAQFFEIPCFWNVSIPVELDIGEWKNWTLVRIEFTNVFLCKPLRILKCAMDHVIKVFKNIEIDMYRFFNLLAAKKKNQFKKIWNLLIIKKIVRSTIQRKYQWTLIYKMHKVHLKTVKNEIEYSFFFFAQVKID